MSEGQAANEAADWARPRPQAHVVVVGNDRLGGRIVDELCDLGIDVVAVCEEESAPLALTARATGATLVVGVAHDKDTLERAGVGEATACGLVCDDDLTNLDVALAVQDLGAKAHLVVRTGDAELGSVVRALVGDSTVLTPAQLSGRSFVQAALRDSAPFVMVVGDRRLAVLEVDSDDPRLLLAIAEAGSDGDDAAIFPTGPGRVLGIVDQGRVAREVPGEELGALDVRIATRQAGMVEAAHTFAQAWSTSARFLKGLLDRRLALVVAFLLMAVTAATLAFRSLLGLDLLTSLYFVVVTVTTTGYGDVNLLDASPAAKFVGMALMGFGVLVLSLVVALVADSVLGARMTLALGHGSMTRSGHVVVRGAGEAGVHILGLLLEAGIPCVAVERHEDSAPVFLRENKVPLIIGDVTRASTVARLRLGSARALISLTNDDLTNISCAMQVQAHAPGLRVVLRMFDADLARRVEQATGYISRSVVSLAAPAFVTALLGYRAAETVPIGRDAVRIVWMHTLRQVDLDSLERDCEARVLAVDTPVFPLRREPIPAYTDVLVVCTRQGMAQVVARLRR